MKGIAVIGINFKTASIELRELFSLHRDRQEYFLNQLTCTEFIDEAFILSTCNRFEIYIHTANNAVAYEQLERSITNFFKVDWKQVSKNFYFYEGINAISHLIRVMTSLDSLIVGEPHILGQAKKAFMEAKASNSVGPFWNQIFERVLKIAKKVRAETKISDKPISVSTVAVELAKRIFGELMNMNTLIIGAGEMSELAAMHLKERSSSNLFFTNRTEEKAIELANRLNGDVLPFNSFKNFLNIIDVILVSISSDGYILCYNDLKSIITQRKNKPILIIDISVPRAIDPEVNKIQQLYLYNIDDLKDLAEHNKKMRKKEAEYAEIIIQRELIKFESWLKSLSAVPLIKALHERAEAIRLNEIEIMKRKVDNLTPEQESKIDLMTKSFMKKLINPLIEEIKLLSKDEQEKEKIDWLRKILRI